VTNGRRQHTLSTPVLIGAVTVLVAVFAVFLAYTTTYSLPFVPMRLLKVDFANGAALAPDDAVHQGGFRIGLVSDIHPIELANGTAGAQVTLKLSEAAGHVPVDSTATVRPLSVLGLKYVNLTYGSSRRTFPNDGTMPLSQTTVPVQFDDVYKTFDRPTRTAVQQNLAGLGDALASRGAALNDTFATLPPLLAHVRPVARYLSDPRTGLTRLLVGLRGFFGTLSPVARTVSRLVTDQATTFAAISRDPEALEAVVRESPPTLGLSTTSLRVQQPLLVDLRTLAADAAPATAELRAALPNVNAALVGGIRVLPRTPQMSQELRAVLTTLRSLAEDPATDAAVKGAGVTVNTVNPLLRYLGPYVTVCNAWNYLWVQLADDISERTDLGMAQRGLVQFNNQQTDSLGTVPDAQPADGQNVPPGQVPEYLHGPPYGASVDTHGNADCEAGQRGYDKKLNQLDPQHRNLVAEQYTPGDQGATWTGLSRVPPGQTFTRRPSTGPQLPIDPKNP
jgi:virulence factor Mce-like protein